MSNLISALAIATGALAAEQGALSETANNVANVNTPGYSREEPSFVENPPVVLGNLTFGTGVSLGSVKGIRDPILQSQIQQETGQEGQLNATLTALQQIEAQFPQAGDDIGSRISALLGSIAQLSANPTSMAVRQGVLTSASNLAATFRKLTTNLMSQQQNLNVSVPQTILDINTLSGQIAILNGQIASLQNVGKDASAFVDQRDVLITQLASLVDVSQIKTESGITLTTANGAPLVAGDQSFALAAQPDSSGSYRIFSQGSDITPTLAAGKLGGVLMSRDQRIPELISSLDGFAAALVNAFNSANRSGFDLNGAAGGDLFVPPPIGGHGAAVGMAVTINDPSLIAASSDGSAGSSGNIVNFSAIHDRALLAGATPSDYYAAMIFGVANDVSKGQAELQATHLVLQQLQDQRGSISGVSLDEEAAHMVQYQRAYEAAARMVTAVNQMLETVINMGVRG